MSDSVRPHRWQPTRLRRPWDSPGKNTGVGCHFLLQCMEVKSESEFAQSCPTLSDPMDGSLPDSSVHGIFQARVLEWVAIAFSSFIHSCPVFPAPFIEEAVFAPLHILVSFVKNKVPIGAWVYFWAFYLVPLVYISVFVSLPYCLDDYSFVV